jgi:hypothetical protein
MSKESPSIREILADIGMGQFNITMAIPLMMVSPATTDPKSNQVILVLQHIQNALYHLGAADVPVSGQLDQATARALEQVVGPNWERMPWAASVRAIVTARRRGIKLGSAARRRAASPSQVEAVGGPLDFLPDVPGGLFSYAVGAFLIYRHFAKRHVAGRH